ncbi:MAG: TonB-dependent receptor plug domain-containing protein [Steroidobacteraceae bacterium]
MFGLNESYTKYLIDGLPMANYPALYNGTDLTQSISGIPSELIDHIDILPGGQSSIYGSDAIAGVVNIVMKKNFEAPLFDAKYGWDKSGGGSDKRFAVADGITLGPVNLVGGIQYEKLAPVWDYQRNITSTFNYGGYAPGIAARDWLVDGYYGQANGNTYYFGNDLTPPVNCNAISGLYNRHGGCPIQGQPWTVLRQPRGWIPDKRQRR